MILAGTVIGALFAPEAAIAGLVRFAPLATSAGAGLVKARDQALNAIQGLKEFDLSPSTSSRVSSAINAIKDHMKATDLSGAVQEARGLITKGDHTQDVSGAIKSLQNLASSLKGALQDSKLDKAVRQAYTKSLDSISKAVRKFEELNK